MRIRTTKAGLDSISADEGNVLTAYRDPVGVWTIGRGHTGDDARQGNTITEERSWELFLDDILETERSIERSLPGDIVAEIAAHPKAWDALVSAVFNIGPKLFRNANGSRTGVFRALVERRWADVANELRRWDKGRVNGKVVALRGLTTRRAGEAARWIASGILGAERATEVGDAGVVPSEPEAPRNLAQTKTVVGAAVSGTAGAIAVGEQISEAAQTAGAFAMPGTWLWTLVGVAVVAGVALTIYGRMRIRRTTGE